MPHHLSYVHAEARAYDGGLPRIMTINIVYYYSLVCTRMSKNDGPACVVTGRIPSQDGGSQGGEYRGRTDDLLHAMQAL